MDQDLGQDQESAARTGTDFILRGQVVDNQVNAGAIEGDVQVGDRIYNMGPDEVQPPAAALLERYLQNNVDSVPVQLEDGQVGPVRNWDVPINFTVQGQLEKGSRPGTDLFQTVRAMLARDISLGRLKRLIILGDPGAGKTTALNTLRIQQAQHSLRDFQHSGGDMTRDVFVVPVFIPLAHLQSGRSFPQLIRDAVNSRLEIRDSEDDAPNSLTTAQAELMLDQGYRCLFLLDGLEDLLAAPPAHGVQALRQFMETEHEHFYVVSCSTPAYRGQLGPAMPVLFLEELRDEDVRAVMGEVRYREINSALRPLLRNRSLLHIVLNLDLAESQVQSKGQLLRELSLRRLGFERYEPDGNRPNPEVLELFLEEFAFALLQNHGRPYSEYDLMQFLHAFLDEWNEPYAWRQVANYLSQDTGILSRSELRQWDFQDSSLRGYFAASALLRQPQRLEQVLADIQGLWWHEALALLIGLQPDPADLCYRLIDGDVFVAASCVRFSGRAVEGRIIDALVDALIETMRRQSSERKRRVIMQLGESGHPRAVDALLLALQRDWSSYVIAGIVRAISVWIAQGANTLLRLEEALAREIGSGPVSEMILLCVQLLLGASMSDEEFKRVTDILDDEQQGPLARGLAALALGYCPAKATACRDALVDVLCRTHLDDFVAWCGVEALTHWDDEVVVDTAQSLFEGPKKIEGSDQWDPRRARAAYLLGWLQCKPETHEILKSALYDEDPHTRGFAIEALVRLDLLDTRQTIESLLDSETDPQVLRKIAEALGQIGDINSIAVLQRFLQGESARTRWIAQSAIQEICHRHELENVTL